MRKSRAIVVAVALIVAGVVLGVIFGTGKDRPLTPATPTTTAPATPTTTAPATATATAPATATATAPATATAVSDQEAIEDVCADDFTHPNWDHYDATVRFSTVEPPESWEVVLVFEYNVAEGYHQRTYNLEVSDTTLVGERIMIWGGLGASAGTYVNAISYSRPRDQDSDQWGEWTVGEEPHYMTGGQESTEPSFCGWVLDDDITIQYLGREQVNGVNTRIYSIRKERDGDPNVFGRRDGRWRLWVDDNGRPVKREEEFLTDAGITMAETTFSNRGEINVITAPNVTPGVTPDIEATPTPTPGLEPEPEPTTTPTSIPDPEVTPEPEPPEPPAPAPPTRLEAWLDPDPATVTLDGGQWHEFTIQGTVGRRVGFAINVINRLEGPTSTGAVEIDSRPTPPSAQDACQATYYTVHYVDVGYTFHMVGCTAGTVIIDLSDPANDYALVRRYTVTVDGGP